MHEPGHEHLSDDAEHCGDRNAGREAEQGVVALTEEQHRDPNDHQHVGEAEPNHPHRLQARGLPDHRPHADERHDQLRVGPNYRTPARIGVRLAHTSSIPALVISASAASVVSEATPAQWSSSTRVSKPSAFASSAVARTQWSVASPTTSTAVTPRAVSQAPSRTDSSADAPPSKPV